MQGNTICVTGHRPDKLPWGTNEHSANCKKLKRDLKKIVSKYIKREFTHFISGLALGIDTYFAEIIIALKKKYPQITLEGAIPCENQACRWNKQAQERYEKIKNKCDKLTILSKTYTPSCMHERNKYMVNNSALVIAVFNGTKGGTSSTIRYATKQKKEIEILDLNKYY